MSETQSEGYKRAVWRHVVGDPAAVEDWSTVRISVYGEDGYSYSSYTLEDPSMEVTVYLGDEVKGRIFGPEAVASLLRSFGDET